MIYLVRHLLVKGAHHRVSVDKLIETNRSDSLIR